ncbi:MAG: catechol 1,2-dioxygenase [Actinomycetota bacterium]|nr:catechol 1,2-dioxygenase [Actinomycetota bacterium]
MTAASEVVLGVGASHTTLMNTRWDEVDGLRRAHDYRDALAGARQAIERSGADLAVVVGPNHFRGMWLDLMPAFTVGIGEVVGTGEHGTPAGPLTGDPTAAAYLLEALMAAGFDPALSARLDVDHGITHAVQHVLPAGLPLVALVVNCGAPPLPSLERCARLGEALREAVHALPGARRVVVVGSGGLSHRLPFPDWRHPASDDDEFLVRSWIEGRGRWEEFETRRRRIVVEARPDINTELDRSVLDHLETGRCRDLVELGDRLVELGGNGANELRNWLVMAGACGWAPGRALCYSPMPEWLTGMAVALVE